MKKIIASFCLLAAVGLTACGTDNAGYVGQAPYAQERTAGATTDVQSAAPVFEKKVTK